MDINVLYSLNTSRDCTRLLRCRVLPMTCSTSLDGLDPYFAKKYNSTLQSASMWRSWAHGGVCSIVAI